MTTYTVKLTGPAWDTDDEDQIFTAVQTKECDPGWLLIPDLGMYVVVGEDAEGEDWAGEIVTRIPQLNPMQAQVREFHTAFGVLVNDEPTLIPEEKWRLRVALIREELEELEDAFKAGDLIAVADALGDLAYVVNGGGVDTGINLAPVVDEIHRSNMSKLGADGKPMYRTDGKVLKGSNYTPPNLGPILDAQKKEN